MSTNTNHNAPAGTWEPEVPTEDGYAVWSFSTEYDGSENYYAEVEATKDGWFTWTVGEAFPGGRLLAENDAPTLEKAQQHAERRFAQEVNQ
ncbi:hypothetical protein [Amycolatopsis sp. CA-230715]|uniref:hypothetical protein n=1 Tax=Amycolatopsis sp. CA-230715 TaxID=2745196 RepID=UPI001C016E00|nr:hypothetical protein [Amycolatopsis sp. CA-230715]QWF78724.1 hypothetical protein HUW46_02122 [Amycolatopsis sp. CA-230715]